MLDTAAATAITLDDLLEDFIKSTSGDLFDMLDDGWSDPSDTIAVEHWTMYVVAGEAELAPDVLYDVLVALEAMARKRLARANTAALLNPLGFGNCDDGASYLTTYAVPTAVRALLHVRAIVAAACPDEACDIVERAAQHGHREAERLAALCDRLLGEQAGAGGTTIN
jgi:hypothetical protein